MPKTAVTASGDLALVAQTGTSSGPSAAQPEDVFTGGDAEIWWYTVDTVTPNNWTAETRDRNELYHDLSLRSVLGEEFIAASQIIPVRANLGSVKALMRDCYIGRGCRQRGLTRSRFANPVKVAEFGRSQAIALYGEVPCVIRPARRAPSHADSLISAYRDAFTKAYDRNGHAGNPPSSQLARVREELESDEGSSADDGAAAKGEDWTGVGRPMQVGVGYTARGCCDGQSLASPGRWPVAARRYAESRSMERSLGLVSSVLPTSWNRRASVKSCARPCRGDAIPCSGCGITQMSDYRGSVNARFRATENGRISRRTSAGHPIY